MAAVIDQTALTAYVQGATVLTQYSDDNATTITRALGVGNNDVLAALRRSGLYASSAIDALAAASAPSVLQSIACAIALDDLTAGVAGRPDSIGEAATNARQKLAFIATGNYVVEGITAATSARVLATVPSNLIYDKDDTDSGSYYRDQDL